MTDKLKTALKFYQSQSPTDANKCYVSDIYATRFSLANLCRFAEAYAAHQFKMPTDEEIHNAYVNYQWALGASDEYHDGFEDGFKAGAEWLRNQINK